MNLAFQAIKRGVMMNKKGSLELSINAIVIIILAITMLGLGLAFMRGVFGGVTQDFMRVSDTMKKDMIDRMKSDTRGIALNVYSIDIKKGATGEVYLGIDNNLDTPVDFTIDIKTDECVSIEDGSCNGDPVVPKTIKVINIPSGTPEVLKIIIKVKPNAPIDTYSFPISVTGGTGGEFDEYVRLNVNVVS